MPKAEIERTSNSNGQQQADSWPNFGTFGCLSPVEITPLDALLDDIRRTQAHILWLEHYIAAMPSAHDPFTSTDIQQQMMQEQGRMGKPATEVARIRWQIQMEKQAKTQTQSKRAFTHPAITALQSERRHLADITFKAVQVGIKLDAIDYSRKQADLIVTAMGRFAIESNMDPSDPQISQRIIDALEHVLNQAANEQQTA